MSNRVVARLAYPLPVSSLTRLVKGLESAYGKGLVIVTDGEDFEPGWLTVSRREVVATVAAEAPA